MRRAFLVHEHVFRPLVEPFLEQLLQAALGVDTEQLFLVGVDVRLEEAADNGQGLVVAAVLEDGADQGLVGAAEDGRFLPAVRGVLAPAEQQVAAQVDLPGPRRQAALVDQGGAQPGEFALAQFREAVEEDGADGQVEDRVTEEFEGFVVAAVVEPLKGEAAVHEGELQQLQVAEGVADPLLQLPQSFFVVLHQGRECGSHGVVFPCQK